MSTVLVSLEEYLNTAYSPDREYVDGEVVERNVGERPHSRVQQNIGFALERKYPRLFVWPEQRLRTIPRRRCRVPDICVTLEDPEVDVFVEPPLLCIEIISKKDRRSRIVAKCAEYAGFGVRHILVAHPRLKKAFVYENGELKEVEDGSLAAAEPSIHLTREDIFRRL